MKRLSTRSHSACRVATREKEEIDTSTVIRPSGMEQCTSYVRLLDITVAWRLAVGLRIYILVGTYFAMALARWISKLHKREIKRDGSTFFFQKSATQETDSFRSKTCMTLQSAVFAGSTTIPMVCGQSYASRKLLCDETESCVNGTLPGPLTGEPSGKGKRLRNFFSTLRVVPSADVGSGFRIMKWRTAQTKYFSCGQTSTAF